jgi:hypothetical protein
MLFSIKHKIPVIGLVMLMSWGVAASTNPFSINIETEKKNIEGEITQVLKVNISSRSIEETKYQLILEIPKGNLSVLEGKKVYSGVIGPLKREDFYLSLKLSSPGEGEIRVKVYNYMDDRELDTQNMRVFYSKYSVTKNVNSAEGALSLSLDSTSEKTGAEKAEDSAGTPQEKEDNKQAVVSEDEGKQKFVVDPKNRYNNFVRVILFVLSFLIIGWLANKIINRRS